MKGSGTPMVALFIAVSSIILYFTVFAPTAALAGEADAQKTLYIAHDLGLLIETISLLPEDANYLLPDVVEGNAELSQGQLIVTGEITRVQKLKVPLHITLADSEADIDFIYVTKQNNMVRLSGTKTTSCLRVAQNDLRQATIKSFDGNEATKKLVEEIVEALEIENPPIKKATIANKNAPTIYLFESDKEAIILGNGLNRRDTSFSCFLGKELDFQKQTNDYYSGTIILTYTSSTPKSKILNSVVRALEDYYES